jgi:hypothetical protein
MSGQINVFALESASSSMHMGDVDCNGVCYC